MDSNALRSPIHADQRLTMDHLNLLARGELQLHLTLDPMSIQQLLFDIKFKGTGSYRYQDEVTQNCGEVFTVDLPRKFKKVVVSFANQTDGHCPLTVTILDPDESDPAKKEKGKTQATKGNDGSVTGENGKRVTFKCEGKEDDGACHFSFDVSAY